MLKKILTLLMSLTLILSLTACEKEATTLRVANDKDNKYIISSESLAVQLQSVTSLVDYPENTSINRLKTVTFGTDIDSQPIEWIVLEKTKNKALLLSKYLLTAHQYNEKIDCTWENSTMRNWLNTEYINKIFSKKEYESIFTTEVINNDNIEYNTNGGNKTKDKLFLLSIDEINKYFSAIKQRVATYKAGNTGFWWLRSPGKSNEYASYIFNDMNTEGFSVVNSIPGVRPALWVKY